LGDLFGVFGGDVAVGFGYQSGAALSGSATYDNATFASLGLMPGSYVYTWGSGANADSLTINIEAVPELSTWAMMALGFAGLGFVGRRRLRAKFERREITAETDRTGARLRTKIGCLATVIVVASALSASASRAAIFETIIDTEDDATVGSITFPTFSGDTDAGVVFSYEGDTGGYTEANITSISWTLNSSGVVLALDLNALRGDNPCPNGGNCSNSTLIVSSMMSSEQSIYCSAAFPCEHGAFPARFISFVPTAIPEPSTWAMMTAGFAGLGFVGWRQARKGRADV
jgi:hypothetical protein